MACETRYAHMDSPFGSILLAGHSGALSSITFQDGDQPLVPQDEWIEDAELFWEAITQLDAYFRGKRTSFELTRLAPRGTEFQQRVWREVQAIPYGQTRSYTQVAVRLGNPRAVRAVGAANGRNSLPVVIPCHRVIGANGQLTGYGAGLPIKRGLLDLELRTLHSIQSRWRADSRTDMI